jgi:hypothetical protein
MKEKILKFNESTEQQNYVWVLINTQSHSYEAILGIYSSFDKAMNSEKWEEYEETPNEDGDGEYLQVIKMKVQ